MNPNILQSISRSLGKNKPVIKIGIGIGSLLSGTVLAVIGTVKAIRKCDERKVELEVETLPKKEIVKITYRYYIPTVSSILIGLICLYSGTNDFKKRNVAMMSAVATSEMAFETYKSKVRDILGEEKAKEISTAIVQDKANKEPPPSKEVVIINDSERLCYDPYSARYFYADGQDLRRFVNELNYEMQHDGINGYRSLNDFYDKIPLDSTKRGEDIGWNIDKGLIEIRDSEAIKAPDGQWATIVDFNVAPYDGYDFL